MSDVVRIVVTPLDKSAPGSMRLQQRLKRLLLRAQQSQAREDLVGLLEADSDLEDYVLSRMATTDGTDLEVALDEISADDWEQLVKAVITGQVDTGGVDPLTNGSPSKAPALSPSGS
jgi:hypothetical protein